MGHPDFINIRECEGHFYRRILMDGVDLVIDIPAWFLQQREIHRLRIPSQMSI